LTPPLRYTFSFKEKEFPMPKVTLLADGSTTQSITLSRIPTIGEYIFFNNETLAIHRVIHIPRAFGSQALISVRIIE
jgi:hypothetical protein